MSCTVRLRVRAASTKWGEKICVVGNVTQLGAWSTPIELTTNSFPEWTVSCTLPASTRVEYKYLVVCNGVIQRWENVPSNRTFITAAPAALLQIDDGHLDRIARVEYNITNARRGAVEDSSVPCEQQGKPDSVQVDQCDCNVDTPPCTARRHSQLIDALRVELNVSRMCAENVREQVRTIRTIACEPHVGAVDVTAVEETVQVCDVQRMSASEVVAAVQSYLDEAAIAVGKIRADLRSLRLA